jgi:hypothetical protein
MYFTEFFSLIVDQYKGFALLLFTGPSLPAVHPTVQALIRNLYAARAKIPDALGDIVPQGKSCN